MMMIIWVRQFYHEPANTILDVVVSQFTYCRPLRPIIVPAVAVTVLNSVAIIVA